MNTKFFLNTIFIAMIITSLWMLYIAGNTKNPNMAFGGIALTIIVMTLIESGRYSSLRKSGRGLKGMAEKFFWRKFERHVAEEKPVKEFGQYTTLSEIKPNNIFLTTDGVIAIKTGTKHHDGKTICQKISDGSKIVFREDDRNLIVRPKL